jgi:hypothetical protein
MTNVIGGALRAAYCVDVEEKSENGTTAGRFDLARRHPSRSHLLAATNSSPLQAL